MTHSVAVMVFFSLTLSLIQSAMAQEEDAPPHQPFIEKAVVLPSDESRIFGGEVAPEDPDIHRSTPNGLTQSKSASVRRYMTRVKDQYPRGTCSVFAAVALLESYTTLNLSEQCVAKLMGQEDGGFLLDRLIWVTHHEVFFANDCPYSEHRDQIPANLTLLHTIRAWGRSETRVFSSDESGDPVQFIRESIDAGLPVGTGIWAMGSWWNDPANTPTTLPTGNKRMLPVRNQATGEIRMMEIMDTITIDPAHSRDTLTQDLLRNYFNANKGSPAVRKRPDRHNPHGPWLDRDFDDYMAGIQPLDVPSDDDLRASCKSPALAGGFKLCGAHAIVMTGYDDATETLEFKNSWGEDWRNQGYGHMTYRYFRRFHKAQGDEDAMIAFDNRRWP